MFFYLNDRARVNVEGTVKKASGKVLHCVTLSGLLPYDLGHVIRPSLTPSSTKSNKNIEFLFANRMKRIYLLKNYNFLILTEALFTNNPFKKWTFTLHLPLPRMPPLFTFRRQVFVLHRNKAKKYVTETKIKKQVNFWTCSDQYVRHFLSSE